MASKTTGWIKVATSGPTIDGRHIEPKWLTDIAKTYDPVLYTANIFQEHWSWYGNFGQITAAKTEKDDEGRVCLFVKMNPNKKLLDLNKAGQKLFTSISVIQDFAETGKAYLNHVALTDEPASLGTEQLSFSHNGEQGHIFAYKDPIKIDLEQPESDEELIAKVKQRPSLFKRFFTPQSEQDTDDMSAEEKTALKELQTKFGQLEQQIAEFNTGGETQGDEETPDYEAQFNTLQKQFDEQKTKLDDQAEKLKGYSKLESDFTELSTQFQDAMKDQTPEPDRQTGGSETRFTGF